jgi:hypothetical protein
VAAVQRCILNDPKPSMKDLWKINEINLVKLSKLKLKKFKLI